MGIEVQRAQGVSNLMRDPRRERVEGSELLSIPKAALQDQEFRHILNLEHDATKRACFSLQFHGGDSNRTNIPGGLFVMREVLFVRVPARLQGVGEQGPD